MTQALPIARDGAGVDLVDASRLADPGVPLDELGEEHGHRILRVCGQGG